MIPLEYLNKIESDHLKKLEEIKIKTVDDLIKKATLLKGRMEIARTTGISYSLILQWFNYLNLYKIRGIGKEYLNLLEIARVDTIDKLANRNSENIYNILMELNLIKKRVKKLPNKNQIKLWIDQARKIYKEIN